MSQIDKVIYIPVLFWFCLCFLFFYFFIFSYFLSYYIYIFKVRLFFFDWLIDIPCDCLYFLEVVNRWIASFVKNKIYYIISNFLIGYFVNSLYFAHIRKYISYT